mmetsp:Transcript_27474/g.79147  ORF Transcript_27474/g.79147 Transcript_27474/m.79147 type:complete len:183 (-) Transcript_27474:114-662(-)
MAAKYDPNDYALGKPTVPRREISQMAKQAIPGYAGYKPNYMPGRISPAPSVAAASDAGTSDAGSSTARSIGGYPRSKKWEASPGYGGHVPGKASAAGPHVGQRFAAANRAASAAFFRRGGEPEEVPLTVDKLHGRIHVPGYSGHMPGVKADTLVGMSSIKAAKEGWLVKNRPKELGGGLVKT